MIYLIIYCPELLNADPIESFDSTDVHPLREYTISYLNRNGQTEWGRSDKSIPLPYETSQIVGQLHEYRKKSLLGAKYNKNLSDSRILSLSFIFPFSHQQIWRNLCECVGGINCSQVCSSPTFPKSSHAHEVFDALYNLLGRSPFDAEPFQIDSSIPLMIQKIIHNFHNYLRQWNVSSTMTEIQFSEQAVFTILLPLFEFKPEYKSSKCDKTMAKSTYKPDLLACEAKFIKQRSN